MSTRCRYKISGDMTECKTCCLKWDTNDYDPPECPFDSIEKEMNKIEKAWICLIGTIAITGILAFGVVILEAKVAECPGNAATYVRCEPFPAWRGE